MTRQMAPLALILMAGCTNFAGPVTIQTTVANCTVSRMSADAAAGNGQGSGLDGNGAGQFLSDLQSNIDCKDADSVSAPPAPAPTFASGYDLPPLKSLSDAGLEPDL